MNYFLRTIDSSDEIWSVFDKKTHYIDNYLSHSEMKFGDIVLLFNGKQSSDLESGVYAWGKVVSDIYTSYNEDEGRDESRVWIELIDIDYNKPIINAFDIFDFVEQVRGKSIVQKNLDKLARILFEHFVVN